MGGFSGLITDASSLYVSKPFTLMPIAGDEGYLGYRGYIGWFYWLAAWMAVGLGSVPTQDLMQRSMSARNEATSVWGTYMAGALYLIFGVMSPLIGIAMFKLNPNIAPENTEFLLISAAMQHLHPILTARLYCGAGLGADEHLGQLHTGRRIRLHPKHLAVLPQKAAR